MESDAKLVDMATLKCQLAEQMCETKTKYSDQIQQIQDKINELSNPLNRGNAGEVDVAQTLRDIGFYVEDTSEGEKRNLVFLICS